MHHFMLPHWSALLQQSPHLWLSANRRDGPPHTTPLWFIHEEDAVWVSVAVRSRKVALVRRDQRVSLAIEGTAPGGGLVGEGIAELLDVASRPDVVAALAVKYDGWDSADASTEGPRVLMKITLNRWLLEPA